MMLNIVNEDFNQLDLDVQITFCLTVSTGFSETGDLSRLLPKTKIYLNVSGPHRHITIFLCTCFRHY